MEIAGFALLVNNNNNSNQLVNLRMDGVQVRALLGSKACKI